VTFYLIITVIFFGALGNKINHDNPINYIVKTKFGEWIVGLIIVSNLFLKLNGISQISIYSTGVLEPLAKEGYINKKFAKLNSEHISLSATMLNLLITVLFANIFLVLPFLLNIEIKYDAILSIGAYSLMVVYMLVLLASLKCAYYGHFKLKWWQALSQIITFGLLIFIFGNYFYDLFNYLIFGDKNHQKESLIKLIFFIVVFMIGNLLYLRYHFFTYKHRLLTNPREQQQLDQHFVVNKS
jgi:amino acid transporter